MQQPLVSIVVPVYNAASHLAVCLESIRRQRDRNSEIIVVNDGSDDCLDENATRLLVEKQQETRAERVISHYCHVNNGKIAVYGFIKRRDAMGKKEFAMGLMNEPASFCCGVMWNKLHRADPIRKHDLNCNEQLDLSVGFLFNRACIQHARRLASRQTPVYFYVYSESSTLPTRLDPVGVVKNKAKLFWYYKKLYEDLGLYGQYKPQIYKYLVAVAERL